MDKQQYIIIGLVMGLLLLIVVGAVLYSGDPAKQLAKGRPIHWHADMTARVCGQDQKMPIAEKDGEIGRGLIHTHDDGRVHMEGTFNSEKEVAVRKYLASVGIPFSEKGIFAKADGSPCGSDEPQATASTQTAQKSAKLSGIVNGKPVANILDHSMRDNDKIQLIYE